MALDLAVFPSALSSLGSPLLLGFSRGCSPAGMGPLVSEAWDSHPTEPTQLQVWDTEPRGLGVGGTSVQPTSTPG